jgi:dTDP-4-dehydrorhamnose reductase
MRVLVTGASGQVGTEVVAVCRAAGDDVVACTHTTLDVTDRDAVLAVITTCAPDAVVHAAAWTAVDACEADPDRAFAVNALGARHVAEATGLAGARLLYLSTDYVFDGTKPEPYVEWDVPNPRSVYGASKLAGEHEVATLGIAATVVRLSWVCGAAGPNMVKTVLRLAADPGELRFVDDQRGRPTFADSAAPLLRRLLVERRPGLFHVTNRGAVSWFEFARAVLDAAGADAARVVPIRTADLVPARPAARPANSVLDNAALRLSGLPLLPDFHEPLARLVRELT